MNRLARLLNHSNEDPNVVRIRRRKALFSVVDRRQPLLRLALFIVGYVWMLVIPSPELGSVTYIDENALQPGQVNMYWGWEDVRHADLYLERLEMVQTANYTSDQRAQYIATEFKKLDILASTQDYIFSTQTGTPHGTNVYAILSSPRASGTEAIVISASWLSRIGEGDGTLNLRGVSIILALARFLKGYSLWAKDIIFVISDGYLEGMQAWLSAYYGTFQSNLQAERLELTSGVIWTALNIDYPGHSFSHLGIFHEGVNGRLPNQDLINSFSRISQYSGHVPVTLYDHLEPRENAAFYDDTFFRWLPVAIREQENLQAYTYQAKNVLRHLGYQARGQPSGIHGLFHQFRVDAFTVFALPAVGPHGFHSLGRVVESTLRTMNNLLERLHASFFFYILTTPHRFMKIGSFLPSAVLVSVAMMFGGLKEWKSSAWVCIDHCNSEEREKKEEPLHACVRRKRPIIKVLGIMLGTHVIGGLLFWLLTKPYLTTKYLISAFFLTYSLPLVIPSMGPNSIAPPSPLLKAFNLCFASTVISTTSVLNFSLAASLAVLLGVPLSISGPSKIPVLRQIKYTFYYLLGFGWLIVYQDEIQKAVRNWELLGVWFAPFVCIVYAPLILQAAIACRLPP